jgi:outer membrane protein assembly factor BamB
MDRRQFLQGVGATTVGPLFVSMDEQSGGDTGGGQNGSQDWGIQRQFELSDIEPTEEGYALEVVPEAEILVVAGEGVAAYDTLAGEQIWVHDSFSPSSILVTDETVFLVSDWEENDDSSDEPKYVRAVSLETGELSWDQGFTLSGNPEEYPLLNSIHRNRPVPYNSTVLFGAGRHVFAMGFLHETVLVDIAAEGDSVYLTTVDGSLICYDRAAETQRWLHDFEETDESLTGVTVSGETVLAAGSNRLYAVSTDGQPQWTYAHEDYKRPSGTIATDDDRCYLRRWSEGSMTTVVALDLANGTEQWTQHPSPVREVDGADRHAFSPHVVGGHVWAFGAGDVLVLDAETGKISQRTALAGVADSPLAIDGEIGYVVVGNSVYILGPADNADCESLSIDNVSASIESEQFGAEEFRISGELVDLVCFEPVRVEALVERELFGSQRITRENGTFTAQMINNTSQFDSEARMGVAEETGAFSFSSFPSYISSDVDTATVKLIRARDGTLLEERTVEISDYRDDPPSFELRSCESEGATWKGMAGEEVDIPVNVANRGGSAEYVVRVEADGEVVDEVGGSVSHLRGDQLDCHIGKSVTLSPQFSDPGEYSLQATVLEPDNGEVHDTIPLGTAVISPIINRFGKGIIASILAGGSGYLLAKRWRDEADENE